MALAGQSTGHDYGPTDKNWVAVVTRRVCNMKCFHMMLRRPCWCPKSILWELNSFLTQTLAFVPIICIDAAHVSENTLKAKV